MKCSLFALALVILIKATGDAAAESPLDALSWLEGDWVRQTQRGEAIESWKRVSDDTMEGVVLVSSGDSTRAMEYLRIERFGDEVFYIAKPSQNPFPTGFRLMESGEEGVVFENPNHDFPQRIIYTPTGQHALRVHIEATVDGELRGVDFNFQRRILPLAASAQLATQGTVLDHLAGDWVMTGMIAGNEVVHDVDADWVLAGHYLRFHDFSREREDGGDRAYEATVYIGWDAEGGRFVCLWLDVTGGEGLASGVLGYAEPVGDTMPFVFGEGESQIHNTFVYHSGTDSWEWTIVNVRGDERREFAHVTLERRFDAVPGDWSPGQREILDAIAKLSASTATGGGGADDYAAMLTEDFSRWTMGSDVLQGKEDWVEGIRTWYDDGWRVSDRQAQVLEIAVEGGTAFSRRMVSETYAAPDGETSPPTGAALAEVWRRDGEGWRLQRVTVLPIQE